MAEAISGSLNASSVLRAGRSSWRAAQMAFAVATGAMLGRVASEFVVGTGCRGAVTKAIQRVAAPAIFPGLVNRADAQIAPLWRICRRQPA